MAKAGPGSEIMVLSEDRVLAAHAAQAVREMPSIANMNVTNSSKVHVGPKFVSVNQTVQNKEMIKDLPMPKYLWQAAKSTSKAERLACVAAIAAMIIFIALVVYYSVFAGKTTTEEVTDVPPHPWNITREMWLAKDHHWNSTTDAFNPLKLVIIGHTAGNECHTFKECAAELRNLQAYLMREYDFDIQFNFLVGNDGRIYEGLGWNREGAHTRTFNNCTIGIAFMGTYLEDPTGETRFTRVTQAQLDVTLHLLQEGVRMGHLDPSFVVVGARDVSASLPQSPGDNLYREIQKWDVYDHDRRIPGRTCRQIYGLDDK